MPRLLWSSLMCVLLAGCNREPPPQPSAPAAPTTAPSHRASPRAKAPTPPRPTACRWAWSESDNPTFVDCNDKPVQRDYPECFNYSVTEASGSNGCPPSHVEITVSGGPGMLESHRVRVDVGQKEIRFLEKDLVIATASLDGGRVSGFRARRKLPAFHRGKRLKP